jgi:hypothetical protein
VCVSPILERPALQDIRRANIRKGSGAAEATIHGNVCLRPSTPGSDQVVPAWLIWPFIGAVRLPATSATRENTMGHSDHDPAARERRAWNAGGAKRALKPQQVWAIRFWLGHERRLRDRALFDLAIDSKRRGCDVVKVRIGDLISGGQVRTRAIVVQQKTGRPYSRTA